MLLSARVLSDVASVNNFGYGEVFEFTEGDTVSLYFQLIDASRDKDMRPAGRRYIPTAGATLQAVVHNLNSAKTITRFAVQPYAQDGSIWRLDLLATDVVRGTCSIKLTLSEGGVITTGLMDLAIRANAKVRAF